MHIQEIEAPELLGKLQNNLNSTRIIDVRGIQEQAKGTIPGSETMPLATLPLRMNEIKPDDEVVFVCHSGARSAQACAFLKQQGYKNVSNLRGGMLAWRQSILQNSK